MVWSRNFILISSLIVEKKYAVLLVFSIGCLVRTIPELVANPYPIGYDVINYYIPVVTNFGAHWHVVAEQFPLYVLSMYFIKTVSGLDPHTTVILFAIFMYGIFATSLFFVAQRMLKLNVVYSILLTIFVIFQPAALRTTWDLHRDIFGLSSMLLTFSLIQTKQENPKSKVMLIALILSAITASADAMIGSLFVISLIIYGFITRIKIVILCAIVAIIFFTFAVVPSQNIFHKSIAAIPTELSSSTSGAYNPVNLLTLFAVLNGILVPTGIIGFKFLNNNLLKVSLLVSTTASFSWVLFPNTVSLVSDRWIILSGIFLSIFAGYGIICLVHKLSVPSKRKPAVIVLSIVSIFVIMGIAYSIMPSNMPFFLYGFVRNNIETFVPVTMQVQVSSSEKMSDSGKLLAAISWLNTHTEANATIIGDKAWRGWMEIHLKDQRTYRFLENMSTFTNIHNNKYQQVYLLVHFTQNIPDHSLHVVYSNDIFRVFRVESHTD